MLYDEPTTGLDPITATSITDLIVKVRDIDGVASILVTHQLRDAFNVARTTVRRTPDGEDAYDVAPDLSTLQGTEFLMLREGQVLFEGSPQALSSSGDPYIREFLS
jgi:phospholipid/cholesterol/gamma-HCH transport system ATP-binding protein